MIKYLMSTYHPDSWVPLLIETEKQGKVYKILAGWYGGFGGSDSWKISSGIESILVEEIGDARRITMPQSSGSTYVVGEHTHMSSLMAHVLSGFTQKQMNKRFFRAKTREQATQRLEEFHRQLRWHGSYWEGRVISLKHQAQSAPMIMLSTDDHSLICNGDGHLA